MNKPIVPDPYRWLENIDSPETSAWVAAEKTLTQSYFAQIPQRAAIAALISTADHGGGRPIAKVIDDYADTYAFLVKNLHASLPAGFHE
ncbi:MAG TPA: hypothetical protein VIG32_00425 [Candidatus Baltobacteraceae bacterium]